MDDKDGRDAFDGDEGRVAATKEEAGGGAPSEGNTGVLEIIFMAGINKDIRLRVEVGTGT